MKKELEALEYVKGKIADLEDDLQHYTMVEKDKCKEFYIREDLKVFKGIEQALTELKAIKEAEPSEALECSLKLYKMVESAGNGNGFNLNTAWEYHNTIKQALLKQLSGSQYTNIAIDEAVKPSEALEKLESIREYSHSLTMVNYLVMNSDLDIVKQALLKSQEQEKVLDIILKKQVDIMWLYQCVEANRTFEDYNSGMGRELEYLTEEEFQLLKKYSLRFKA